MVHIDESVQGVRHIISIRDTLVLVTCSLVLVTLVLTPLSFAPTQPNVHTRTNTHTYYVGVWTCSIDNENALTLRTKG